MPVIMICVRSKAYCTSFPHLDLRPQQGVLHLITTCVRNKAECTSCPHHDLRPQQGLLNLMPSSRPASTARFIAPQDDPRPQQGLLHLMPLITTCVRGKAYCTSCPHHDPRPQQSVLHLMPSSRPASTARLIELHRDMRPQQGLLHLMPLITTCSKVYCTSRRSGSTALLIALRALIATFVCCKADLTSLTKTSIRVRFSTGRLSCVPTET